MKEYTGRKPISITGAELNQTVRKNFYDAAQLTAQWERTSPTKKELEKRAEEERILPLNICGNCGKSICTGEKVTYKNLIPYHVKCPE